jgi:hypothetical protein
MTESLHRELQPLRANVFDVAARLRQDNVFFVLNHLLHFYREQAPIESYLRLLVEVPALEARNGAMCPAHNELIERCGGMASPALALVGGSDAHTLRRVGRTWTEVPGARNASEFLAGLRSGRCRPGGDHGGTLALAGDVYGVVFKYIASLFGMGPRDHTGLHRVGCGAFSIASLPFQFIPLVVAAVTKSRERRIVAKVNEVLAPRLAALRSSSGAEPTISYES